MGNMTLHAEGTPVCSFVNSAKTPIESLKAYFAPTQSGSSDPSPSNVRPISGWTGLNVYKDDVYLPVEYQRVEYLESTGTQYLISDIPIQTPITIDTEVIFTDASRDQYIVSAGYDENNNNYRVGGLGAYRNQFQFNFKTYFIDGTCKNDVKYNVHAYLAEGNQKIDVDNGQTITRALTHNNALDSTKVNFGIFCQYKKDVGPQYIGKVKLFLLKFSNSSSVIGNFIPCLRRSDSKPGMYDTVTGNFYTNSGTGEFLYGAAVGETIPVTFPVLGKNKFDKTLTPIGAYIDNSGNLISSTASKSFIVPVIPNTEYTVSKIASTRFAVGQSTKDTPEIEDKLTNVMSNATGTSITFTTAATTKSIVLWIYVVTDTVSYNDIINSVQLELGSTTTTYEPYNPDNTVYGGYVDLVKGEVVATHKIFSYKWSNGTNQNDVGSYYRRRFSVNGTTTPTGATSNCCNVGKWYRAYSSNSLHFYNENYYAYVFLPKDTDDNTDVVMCLEMTDANKATYPLTPTILNALRGQNYIWSNATDKIEIDYDLHETKEIAAAKRRIAANTPHIETASGAIATFSTDMKASLKEYKAYFSPKQDLHGYSNPWPAGGGKNIAKPYDNSYVSSTYISFDYSAANGTFRCYGTASDSSTHSSPSATNAVNNGATFTLPAGTYTLSIIDGDGANIYAQCVSSTETVLAETTSYTTFTTNESLTVFVRLKVAAAATVDKTVKIQLEKGSSATSYVPYENVCDISGWTGFNVTKCGKNLLGGEAFKTTLQNVMPVSSTNGNTVVYTNTDAVFHDGEVIFDKFKPNTQYTVILTASKNSNNYTHIKLVYTDNTHIHLNNISPVNTKVTKVYVTNANKSVKSLERAADEYSTVTMYCDECGIFEGNLTANDFVPYSGTTIPVDWTSDGTIYGGYVDLVTGVLTATWGTFDLGDYNWSVADASAGYKMFYTGIAEMKVNDVNVICDQYATKSDNSSNCSIRKYTTGSGVVRVSMHDDRYNGYSKAEYKTAMKGVYIATPLQTPITYQLTPTQLKTLIGTNNIWSDANGTITTQYWKH